jgi:hypothetical protein
MNYRLTKRTMGMVLAAALTTFAWSGAALAHGGGGGGGGGHGGGGGGHGGGGGGHGGGGHYGGGGHFGGGGYRGGYGGRFGGGGYRGGYGGRFGGGGYGGYRGYGWRGGYGGWGWGWGGLGIGLYFATLPYYYSTFWDAGVPYYYADDNYYQWDGNVGQYQTVNPPVDVQRQAEQTSYLIAYPKNGQTEAQQAADKSDCSKWATSQSGFDPTQTATTEPTSKHSDYMRADAACLEGRGYSVK